jgi:hypothetical protein
MKSEKFLALAVVTFVIGITYYYVCGVNIIFFKTLGIKTLELNPSIPFFRNYFSDIIFSIFSILLAIYFIRIKVNYQYIILFLLLGPIHETLQINKNYNGTFDFIDLMISLFPILTISIINKYKNEQKKSISQ